MPKQQHAEGIAFLEDYLAAFVREAAEYGDDAFELKYIIHHMTEALNLTRVANVQEIANFGVGRTLAAVMLAELVNGYRDDLRGWKKFDKPQNPAQDLAKILSSAISVFDRELRKGADLESAYRLREQIGRSFAAGAE